MKLSIDQQTALGVLIALRHAARKQIEFLKKSQASTAANEKRLADAIQAGDRIAQVKLQVALESSGEDSLEIEYNIIELGQTFVRLTDSFDALPREVWLRALCVNESEWSTDRMQRYGQSILNVVSILRLENSATAYEGVHTRPLNWCYEMAKLNALSTNATLAKATHEKINAAFGGCLGEWHEPSLMQRLGVNHG